MNSDIWLTYSESLPEDMDFSKLAASDAPAEDAPAPTSPAAAFIAVSLPDFSYLATTSRISIDDIPTGTYADSVTDGYQTVTFDSRMRKLSSGSINNWGVPPFTEDPNIPQTLISDYTVTSMTWVLSRPSKVFGFELMPNAFGTFTYRAEFFIGPSLIGSITRTITVPGPPLGPETQGARLFAAITDDAGFDRIVITSLSGNTIGFLVSQLRYQACVKLCNVIIENAADLKTTIPVICCVSVPGFEVASVSSDIGARILDTCCDIQEDFICPGFGPIAGVKTARVKIFAELLIPVMLRSGYGCPPITMQHTCTAPVIFTIYDAFIASEIKNCKVLSVSDVIGSEFQVDAVEPCSMHCCVSGYASISTKVSACVMTSSIAVKKC